MKDVFRLLYLEKTLPYEELLLKDSSVSIHHTSDIWELNCTKSKISHLKKLFLGLFA